MFNQCNTHTHTQDKQDNVPSYSKLEVEITLAPSLSSCATVAVAFSFPTERKAPLGDLLPILLSLDDSHGGRARSADGASQRSGFQGGGLHRGHARNQRRPGGLDDEVRGHRGTDEGRVTLQHGGDKRSSLAGIADVVAEGDVLGQGGAHLAGGRFELRGDEDEAEAECGRAGELDKAERVIAPHEDESPEDGRGAVVGVEAADGLLGLEPGEHEVVAGEQGAEERVHGLGGGRCGGGRGAEAGAERQALGETERDAVRADAEGAERGDGGDARAVAERVAGEAVGQARAGRGGDAGDGDHAGGQRGVKCGGHGVAEGERGVGDGAAQEVEARAEVRHRSRRERRDGPEGRGRVGRCRRGGDSELARDAKGEQRCLAGGGGGGWRGGRRRRRRRHCGGWPVRAWVGGAWALGTTRSLKSDRQAWPATTAAPRTISTTNRRWRWPPCSSSSSWPGAPRPRRRRRRRAAGRARRSIATRWGSGTASSAAWGGVGARGRSPATTSTPAAATTTTASTRKAW